MSEKTKEIKSLKDRIKEGGNTKRELVDIEELDCTVEIREFGGIERGTVIRATADLKGEDFQRELFKQLLLRCVYDPNTGKRLFAESDLEWLLEKQATILEQMISPAIKLNGLFQKQVDEEAKN